MGKVKNDINIEWKRMVSNDLVNGKVNIEMFFNEYQGEIYSFIFKSFSNNVRFKSIFDQVGAYEILINIRNIILKKKLKSGYINIDNFKSYIYQCASNVLRNESRKKRFLDFKKEIPYESKSFDNLENFQFSPQKENSTKTFSSTLEKLYLSYYNGDIDQAKTNLKYSKKVINRHEEISNLEKSFYNAHILFFRAKLYFNQGKLSQSSKCTDIAVNLFSKKEIINEYGHLSLIISSNLKATILINQGFFLEGVKLLKKLIESEDEISSNNFFQTENPGVTESKLLLSMFLSGNYFKYAQHYINEVKFESNATLLSLQDKKKYAKAYLLIDNNKFDQAHNLLNDIEKTQTSDNISKLRFYTAKSELLIQGFQPSNSSDLVYAEEYLSEAEKINSKIGSKYFDSIHNILRGHVINNNSLLLSGIKNLKKHGFVHYSDWYRYKSKISKI